MIFLLALMVQVAPSSQDLGSELFKSVNENSPTNVIRDLLDKGAPVNARSRDKVASIMAAAYLGNVSTVQLLVERGAVVDAQDAKGNSALIYAVANKHVDTNRRVVDALLAAGADPDLKAKNGDTPLLVLSRANNVSARLPEFMALVQRGADVNAQGPDGRTAAINLALNLNGRAESLDVLEFILTQGVAFDLRDQQGMTLDDYVRRLNNDALTKLVASFR